MFTVFAVYHEVAFIVGKLTVTDEMQNVVLLLIQRVTDFRARHSIFQHTDFDRRQLAEGFFDYFLFRLDVEAGAAGNQGQDFNGWFDLERANWLDQIDVTSQRGLVRSS